MNSDSDSSDSSKEYLVPADKLNLNDSFFNKPPLKSQQQQVKSKKYNRKRITKPPPPSSSSSSSDADADDENDVDTNALLMEVLKNLEKANASSSFVHTDTETLDNQPAPSSSSSLILSPTLNTSKITKNTKIPPVNPGDLSNEINDLLRQGESGLGSSIQYDDTCDDAGDHESSSVNDKPRDYTIPQEGVNITLPGTSMMTFNRKKRGAIDLQAQLIKRMNQRLRKNQLLIHKVGLCLWLAHGFHLNSTLNDPEIMSTLLSLIPSKIYPDGRVDIKYVEGITKWFKKLIRVEFTRDNEPITRDGLLECAQQQRCNNYRELVLLFIAALRAIGINSRLVMSLCPPAMKLKHSQLFRVKSKETESNDNKNKEKSHGDEVDESITEKKQKVDVKPKKNGVKKRRLKSTKNAKDEGNDKSDKSKITPTNSSEADSIAMSEAKKRAVELLRSKYSMVDNKNKLNVTPTVKLEKLPIEKLEKGKGKAADDDDDKINDDANTSRAMRLRSRGKKGAESTVERKNSGKSLRVARKVGENAGKSAKAGSSRKKSDDVIVSDDNNDDDDDKKPVKLIKSIKSESEADDESYEESSSDETDSDTERQRQRKVAIRRKRKISGGTGGKAEVAKSNSKSPLKVLSSDDDEETEIIDTRDARYLWAEVYVESEESWISASIIDTKVHCVSDIYKKAPTPVLYVIAWNTAGTVKDVTRRYCPHWLTATRKQRIDESWWCDTLQSWREKKTVMSKAEDEALLQMELEQPLPDAVGKYKGHPLYVLARHLLKYEGLYPADCVPIGHLKNGEAVYSRHCVHTLRSRETWLKEARVVKPKQEPYKIVKSMPKLDRFTGQRVTGQPLELFGKWQTTAYDPPVAKNGIVPRNEYGNVDLFKQCMLPKGTVHIDLPGLGRVAKKLKIDAVPAVVGFNFGCRGAMPMTEGFVVCEEYETTVRDAWENEQIAAAKREKDKRDKRIWGNWRRLIRGLLIKQKLEARYNMKDNDDNDDDNTDNDSGDKNDNNKGENNKKSKCKVTSEKRSKTDKRITKRKKTS